MKFFEPTVRVVFALSALRWQAKHALEFWGRSELVLEAIQKERGYCHIARIPPGIDAPSFTLFEDHTALGPADRLHDEIRTLGNGRFSIWGRFVYFSASDNSDARLNNRAYALRRVRN